MTCDKCDSYRADGANFCPECGAQLVRAYKLPVGVRKKYGFIFFAGLVAAVQGLLIMFFEILIGWGKMRYAFDYLADQSYMFYYITPHLEDLVELEGVQLQIIYVLEMAFVTFCLGYMVWLAYRKFRDTNGDLGELKNTAAYEAPVILGLVILAEMAYMLFLIIIGAKIESPDGMDESGRMIFALLNASVYEEILCRLLMVGLPCLIVALILKREGPKHRYLLGGAKFEWWMVIFVLFSSTMFGLAHLDNWDTWKFFPTFMFGLAAGYVYLRYGLYATVSMHFINDFLNASYWAGAGQATFILGILAVGICSLPCVIDYAKRGYLFTSSSIKALKKER